MRTRTLKREVMVWQRQDVLAKKKEKEVMVWQHQAVLASGGDLHEDRPARAGAWQHGAKTNVPK